MGTLVFCDVTDILCLIWYNGHSGRNELGPYRTRNELRSVFYQLEIDGLGNLCNTGTMSCRLSSSLDNPSP